MQNVTNGKTTLAFEADQSMLETLASMSIVTIINEAIDGANYMESAKDQSTQDSKTVSQEDTPMSISIPIHNDLADLIVKQSLLEAYSGILYDIELLERKSSLMPHEVQDLADFKRYKSAFIEIITYYAGDDWTNPAA